MSTIQRAAWMVQPPNQDSLFVTNKPDGREFWHGQGFRVSPVVEVQPVLDALWAMREMQSFERHNAIVELIMQLEKAAQP